MLHVKVCSTLISTICESDVAKEELGRMRHISLISMSEFWYFPSLHTATRTFLNFGNPNREMKSNKLIRPASGKHGLGGISLL